ncbi:hypothetical protein, partial [Aeromonas veronii]|uniref:hypothetical protein n=1 Tax=Aeromonas veronii TaxID=654 RepID=UPI001961CB64
MIRPLHPFLIANIDRLIIREHTPVHLRVQPHAALAHRSDVNEQMGYRLRHGSAIIRGLMIKTHTGVTVTPP